MAMHVPNAFRVRAGRLASDDGYGNNGAFFVPNKVCRQVVNAPLRVVASDGEGWEHVSVSLPNRCPTWEEMAFIKNLFWDAEDCVMQLHPPASQYVNNHPYCLHLWRPVGAAIPQPPAYTVGLPGLTPDQADALAHSI